MEARFFAQAVCLGKPICYDLLCEEASYGVAVRYNGEEVRIPNISTHPEVVHCLLEQMTAGAVTPVTAKDIVEDWLGV